ncbi:hypothetical protein E2C01_065069 [Portunus trituberculatus]|uniref:Uncharacterized protein n=1 Tax=Portunus trituberculatus TaxID=210409 RepID=A0A5B7HEP5_PORTR|nr:hypothetical protein [Portunus trituberculatus]
MASHSSHKKRAVGEAWHSRAMISYVVAAVSRAGGGGEEEVEVEVRRKERRDGGARLAFPPLRSVGIEVNLRTPPGSLPACLGRSPKYCLAYVTLKNMTHHYTYTCLS